MHLVDITMFYAAQGGGITTYLNAKADHLARQVGLDHTILSPNVNLPGLPVPGLHGYRFPHGVEASARAMALLRPDLIEAGDASPCAWSALRASRRLGVPSVAFYHSDLHSLMAEHCGAFAAACTARYLRRLYGQFDLVLAPSRVMQTHLGELGVRSVALQPLGVDCAVFSPRRRDHALRARLGLPPSARLLVYAGRFTPQKKLAVLARAVERLGAPYHLLLVGCGAPPPPSPRMTVLPFERDPRALASVLGGCDLLVHPGDQETFGLIAIEAMACGIPVLGTGGGVAELIDADCGLVVRPDSADSLCQGVAALFGADLAALGASARRKARLHHDWQRIMPQLLGRYAILLAARSHRPAARQPQREQGLVRD